MKLGQELINEKTIVSFTYCLNLFHANTHNSNYLLTKLHSRSDIFINDILTEQLVRRPQVPQEVRGRLEVLLALLAPLPAHALVDQSHLGRPVHDLRLEV